MTKEEVIKKIRKLLKLQYSAEKVGSTGEAYKAANIVRNLLMEYNLSMSDIGTGTEEEMNIVESDDLSFSDQYGIHWKRMLLSVICEHNLCELIYCAQRKRMNIVGSEANMVIVREFYIYLVRVFSRLSMERLNEAQNEAMRHGKFMIEPQKKKYIKSYLEGVPFGLDENYKSLAPTSAETGLMVTHKAVIKSYLERKHKNLRTGRHPKLEVEEDAFGVGYQDGRKVSLKKQIEKNNKLERYGNNTV